MSKKKNLRDLDEFDKEYIESKMNNGIEDRGSNTYTNCSKALNYKISIKCKNKKQKEFLNILKNERNEICFGVGSAGSGKSFISIGYALQVLKDAENPYKKIIIIVPTCEAGNMSLGFLKGTLEEKLAPYLEADSYTMEKILSQSGNQNSKQIVNELIKCEMIDYQLVNFARGKTFDNCILLINESENYSKEEILLLLTRIGENCKLIVTGDPIQLDRKDIKKTNSECGLTYAMNKLCDLEEVDCITFDESDIVRNPLISKILQRFKD
jgi:phosphate starvation-inducible PhoH-like protein